MDTQTSIELYVKVVSDLTTQLPPLNIVYLSITVI
jgi:hypothetical protein